MEGPINPKQICDSAKQHWIAISLAIVVVVWEFGLNLTLQKGYLDNAPAWVVFWCLAAPIIGLAVIGFLHPFTRKHRCQLRHNHPKVLSLLIIAYVAILLFLLWICYFLTHPKAMPNDGKTPHSQQSDNGRTKRWQPPELPPGCKEFTVCMGSENLKIDVVNIGTRPSTMHNWQNGISVYVIDNRVFIDAACISLGKSVEIRKGRIYGLPEGWDWNCNSGAVEIVDASLSPVYQVRYIMPDFVFLQGCFLSKWGDGSKVFGGDKYNFTNNLPFSYNPAQLGLARIFMYPSDEHPGEIYKGL